MKDASDTAIGAGLGIFISYAQADVEHVLPVARALSRCDFRVWIDTEQIHPSSYFMDEIQPAIVEHEAFLFFYSLRSAASPYCLRELDAAVASRSTIIPVWLEKPTPHAALPSAIDGLAGVAAYDHPADTVLARLTAALQSDAASQRLLKGLQVAAQQWNRAGRPSELLLISRRLNDVSRLVGGDAPLPPALTQLEVEFLDVSRRFQAAEEQRADKLQRSSAVAQALQSLDIEPKDALLAALGLARGCLDATSRSLLCNALVRVGAKQEGSYSARANLAYTSDMKRWAGTGYSQFGRSGFITNSLGEPPYGITAEGDFLGLRASALAFQPETDVVCLAAERENFFVGRVSDAQASDGFSAWLKFERFVPHDRSFRVRLEGLIEGVGLAKLFADAPPIGVNSIAFSPDGRWLAAAHADHRVRVYDFEGRRSARWWKSLRAGRMRAAHRLDGIYAGQFVRFSASGRYLISVGTAPRRSHWRWHRPPAFGSGVRGLDLIETEHWRPWRPWLSWPDRPWLGDLACARLSADDRFLLLCRDDESYVVSLDDGAYLVVPQIGVRFAEFTPDGRGLVCVGTDNVVRGWAWDGERVGCLSQDGWRPQEATEVFAWPSPSAVHEFVMLANGRWVMIGAEHATTGLFCDLFGDDGKLLACAEQLEIEGTLPFP